MYKIRVHINITESNSDPGVQVYTPLCTIVHFSYDDMRLSQLQSDITI